MVTKSWKTILRRSLPPAVVRLLIGGKIAVMTEWWSVQCDLRKLLFLHTMLKTSPILHIGCGDVHIPGCINVDLRPTRATDIVQDCVTLTSIPSAGIRMVYANAFLEHIFLRQRLLCFRSIRRVLRDDGYAVITAIPDFERIAQAYLQIKPGIISPVFDLMNVYRYTHGEPEGALDWLAQLHKSLFDALTLVSLLNMAGFPSYCIFVYTYRNESIAVSLGFIAYKRDHKIRWTKNRIKKHLGPLAADVNLSSVKIIRTFPR